jgi:hypothetical protein
MKAQELSSIPGYTQYDTQYKGQKEIITQPLWDTVVYTSAATTALTFFNAVRATLDLGNMDLAGQLAAPKAFLIRAIRFYVKTFPWSAARAAAGSVTTGVYDDVQQLLNTGVLQLSVGSKLYVQTPLWMIPAGAGPAGWMGLDGNTADPGITVSYAQNGLPQVDNAFVLSRPMLLAPQINFRIDITWPAALTLAGGSPPLTVILDGDLIRPVQ